MTRQRQPEGASGASEQRPAPGPSLVSWLEAVVRAQPSRPAVLQGAEIWSYRELWGRAEEVARGLLETPSYRPRGRVGLVSRNDAHYLAAYLGILRAGGVVVPLNYMLKPAELAAQLVLAGVSDCLLGPVDVGTRETLAAEFGARPIAAVARAGSGPLPEVTHDWEAVLLPTSGTTGVPKAVVLSHGAMAHAALQLAAAFPFCREDVTICFLPLFACIYEQVLPTLFSGGAVDVLPQFDPDAVGRACERATTFDAVPTVMARLLDYADREKLRRLRWVMFASEPMPPPLLERWWDALPGIQTYEFYGMTELLMITYATPECLRSEPRCVGVPFPTSAVDAIDANGRSLPPGEAGEVVCASPTRMRGYFRDEEATKAAFTASGAMWTGDLGTFDEAGRLHLTGRLKDIIISGGLNIAPAEIEAVACRHPMVAAAAVVGIPDTRFGETPVVVAVPKPGHPLSARELLAYCRAELSSFKRPSAAAVVDRLPQTGIGKSAKSELREAIMREQVKLERAY